jgi:hypothetical protein
MSVLDLIGNSVRILVSDPWEFGTECGVGPFIGIIDAIRSNALIIRLLEPIAYRGGHLFTIVAQPRHAPGTLDTFVSVGNMSANLMLLRVSVENELGLNDQAKAGMVAAIGSVELVLRDGHRELGKERVF